MVGGLSGHRVEDCDLGVKMKGTCTVRCLCLTNVIFWKYSFSRDVSVETDIFTPNQGYQKIC
jgi:hypothetical protein